MLIFNKKYTITKKTNVFSTKNTKKPSKKLKVGTKIILCAMLTINHQIWLEIRELDNTRLLISKKDMDENCKLTDKINQQDVISVGEQYQATKTIRGNLTKSARLSIDKGDIFKIIKTGDKYADICIGNLIATALVSDIINLSKPFIQKPISIKVSKIQDSNLLTKCSIIKVKQYNNILTKKCYIVENYIPHFTQNEHIPSMLIPTSHRMPKGLVLYSRSIQPHPLLSNYIIIRNSFLPNGLGIFNYKEFINSCL